ncbi:MAG: hypothetical protein E5Y88_11530 [Mesorhizobium sp.]|uniref:hypothetical protein n=1 Tax=Mesorhizobium sp. TaxID=1871066 RepID=UPI001208ACDA|nr:hypothetical protein [Mesorhizobium sp.]TIL25583.1 MAG: hypothetical protein E5Y88_11530 [Mesorhizobium sp.]
MSNQCVTGDLPTGPTGISHQHCASIDEAARWYAEHRDTCEKPIIPALRNRFGLTAHEAVTAIRQSAVGRPA